MRVNNKLNDENAPHPCDPKAKEKTRAEVRPRCSIGSSGARGGKRTVLREKTNVTAVEEGGGRRGGGGKAQVVRPCVDKGLRVTRGVGQVTSKRRSSVKASPKQAGSGPRDESDSLVAVKKHCVYANAGSSVPAVPAKESIYDFEVDGSEPPSRRRRRRPPPNAKNNKAFPRFPSVRHRARSETTTSSLDSVGSSSIGWHSLATKAPEVPTLTKESANCMLSPPLFDVKLKKRPSTVLESPLDAATSTCAPQVPLDEVMAATACDEAVSEDEGPCSGTTPEKFTWGESLALHGNSQLHEPTLSTLFPSNSETSFFLRFANYHSTPVKTWSASDSSSAFTQSQTTAEKCFGFSSDEEEVAGGMPSPLSASPQCQAVLVSSPPQAAPSRFAPEVVRRALILDAASRPPQSASNQRCAKLTGRRRKQQGALDAAPECPLEQGAVALPSLGPATPTGPGLLFGDAVGEDVSFIIQPPRRSYERPRNRKLKKVIGEGLCLVSSEEEGGEEGGERSKAPPEVPKVRQPQPKEVARQRTKAERKKENQLEQWATQINSQFDEVEDFELCLG